MSSLQPDTILHWQQSAMKARGLLGLLVRWFIARQRVRLMVFNPSELLKCTAHMTDALVHSVFIYRQWRAWGASRSGAIIQRGHNGDGLGYPTFEEHYTTSPGNRT